jgi:hypothetical protein
LWGRPLVCAGPPGPAGANQASRRGRRLQTWGSAPQTNEPGGLLPIVLSVILMTSEEDLKAEIERLRAENATLKKPARGQMSLKVSEKGGLSVYGLGRFPVTLYREQWEKLLGMADEIRQFIAENDAALKKKE